jgi:hypothetical protein
MSVLPKFTADYNEKSSNWRVTNDATNKVIATFETKADMTERDALRSALGSAGGAHLSAGSGSERIQRLTFLAKGSGRPTGRPFLAGSRGLCSASAR